MTSLRSPNNFDVTYLKYECLYFDLGILRKVIKVYIGIVFYSLDWSVSGPLVLSKF